MPSTNGATPDEPRKLKILMLHGFTQSGTLFHAKTRALQKALEKAFPAAPSAGYLAAFPGGIELIYPTAPIRLYPRDLHGFSEQNAPQDEALDSWGWWRRNDETGEFEGMDSGFSAIASVMKERGPIQGVIGLSQGGYAAGMTASLLEPGRPAAFAAWKAQHAEGVDYPASFLEDDGTAFHPPLRFAVAYSGAIPQHERYGAFYSPKIATPMLHFIGTLDTVVSEERSLQLADACAEKNVIYHPGGHFLPGGKQFVSALIGFMREAVEGKGKDGKGNKEKEESVEDMDVPF